MVINSPVQKLLNFELRIEDASKGKKKENRRSSPEVGQNSGRTLAGTVEGHNSSTVYLGSFAGDSLLGREGR